MSANPQTGVESQRLSLHPIPRVFYQSLLGVLSDAPSPRLASYEGTLELMAPTSLHEHLHRLFADGVDALAEAREIEGVHTVVTTLQRADVEAGLEADESFYIAHAYLVPPRHSPRSQSAAGFGGPSRYPSFIRRCIDCG